MSEGARFKRPEEHIWVKQWNWPTTESMSMESEDLPGAIGTAYIV
jgi:hypothetical protein